MKDHSRGSLLTAVLRRLTAERPAHSPAAPPAPPSTWPPSAGDDYGMLRPVASVDDLDTARSIRGMLAGAGVRATFTTGQDGRVRVLVFPQDHDRAERLVSWAL